MIYSLIHFIHILCYVIFDVEYMYIFMEKVLGILVSMSLHLKSLSSSHLT